MTYRSLLFVPGSRPDRFIKALDAGADAVCIDLEDAVPPAGKAEARAQALAFLASDQHPVARGLRINGVRSADGLRDLVALLDSEARSDFLMVPKVAAGEDLALIAEALGSNAPPLWPVVESAEGLRRVWDICAAPGVAGVLFGGADLSADLGSDMGWDALLLARSTLVSAAARAGIATLDVPHLDLKDPADLVASTARAKALGFTGRSCIHPNQVAVVNATFSPSPAELERARRVVEAFDAAGGAAALLDGKLIELPVIRAARRVLSRI
jgi:citrate lyase subunit beta/citryl-CoA lyase/(S)-citramalyl-CoA lyase